MKIKLLLILIIVFFTTSLFAKYDEKEILLKNASDMVQVRKYSLAQELYEEALTKFPGAQDVIVSYLELFIKTSKGQEGLNLLKEEGNSLSNSDKSRYEITFMLIERTFELAEEKANSYLEINPQESQYKNIGDLFQRYRAYQQAVNIYTRANELFPFKFSFELADSYYFDRNYPQALTYYLQALEHDISSKNLINSRIGSIIKQDPNSISVLMKHFGTDPEHIVITKDNKSIIDVYAQALLTTGKGDIALAILDKYQAQDIYNKAEQFKRLKEYEISSTLYDLALSKVQDTRNYYMYTFNYAKMLFESSAYSRADSLINIIIDDDSDMNNKRNVLFNTYLLKADITFRQKDLSNHYESYLQKAEKYAYNNNQKTTLKSRLSYYKILTQEYPQAKDYLDELEQYGRNSDYFFNYYLYEVFQNGSFADSLATELIIQAPESDNTSEMLNIKFLLKSLSGQDRNLFLDAYRKEKLFLLEEADSLYNQLFESSKNEYFIIKNALMNIENSNKIRAQKLLSRPFEDTFARDFASLQLVLLEDKKSKLAQNMARNFLTLYPNSSLAARVRKILLIEQNK